MQSRKPFRPVTDERSQITEYNRGTNPLRRITGERSRISLLHGLFCSYIGFLSSSFVLLLLVLLLPIARL
jgi:hypothetical protein